MDELWQLYSEQGTVLPGKGDTKDNIFGKGLLHAASHVWIWRSRDGVKEVLLQKRAATKRTWPGRYDISAAGHIDLDETPLEAAIRETKEEINIDVNERQLKLFGVYKTYMVAENGSIENEFQWLYSLELSKNATFKLEAAELESIVWVSLDTFKKDCSNETYVPHSPLYYSLALEALKKA